MIFVWEEQKQDGDSVIRFGLTQSFKCLTLLYPRIALGCCLLDQIKCFTDEPLQPHHQFIQKSSQMHSTTTTISAVVVTARGSPFRLGFFVFWWWWWWWWCDFAFWALRMRGEQANNETLSWPSVCVSVCKSICIFNSQLTCICGVTVCLSVWDGKWNRNYRTINLLQHRRFPAVGCGCAGELSLSLSLSLRAPRFGHTFWPSRDPVSCTFALIAAGLPLLLPLLGYNRSLTSASAGLANGGFSGVEFGKFLHASALNESENRRKTPDELAVSPLCKQWQFRI